MRWKDFLTTKYKKLDICLEKVRDVRFLSLLHDAYFDSEEIRYARKRLVIPIKDRTTWEWTPMNDRMPGGEVDGELCHESQLDIRAIAEEILQKSKRI